MQSYLSDRVKGVLTGAGEPIVVRIQGPEREVLRREAEKVAKILSGIAGVANPRVESRVETPQIEIKVDLAAAGQVGLKPGDVRRAAATVFAGLEVGNLFEQQKVFEVVVWGAPESRQSLTDVRELLIDTPDDGHVRLADVAEVNVVPTPAIIEREGVSRRIDIRADVAGRNVSSVLSEVKERLQKEEFPLEYHAVLLGAYEEAAAPPNGRRSSPRWPLRSESTCSCRRASRAGGWRLCCARACWRRSLGGVLAMFAAGGTVLLGSLAGLPRGARHSGAQRHPADQSLPAARARGGRSLRSRACPARHARAARADPDER